ncbi:MAG: D-aminoacylase [Rhodospirillaceae bacterium]|jgi:N-acyl-D-aspartate/D-glutamate deacylase|nr:D-aminoacylase [Rhodospirillaceae bacterium]MBT4689947.1 D-aminoacylase [Rhodospirillaceae bacterium]MBT5193714.1 D-aminoacylase [Rhodospirillaceae bacterium]MBT5894622.1 D-aminoacylase [Rhodospirillaceae bacterium]MBT6429228.1 D-aminoacylase [Rhodospirillaceae bacterium]
MTETEKFDVVISGGRLIDGSGAPARDMDVAISGDRIAAVATPENASHWWGDLSIDASDRVLAPGFIDVHTHDDNAVLDTPTMPAKLSQGVTTVIVGNCGISLAPINNIDPPPPLNLLGGRDRFRFDNMADYLAAVEETRPSVNVAALVGHGTLRVGAMDDLTKVANASEIEVMREKLAVSLEAGAIGMSTGLYYKTSAAASTEEVIALAKVVGAAGGIYTTHMRNEADNIITSLEETQTTGQQAKVPVVISHHKCSQPENWGRSGETLAFIEEARNSTTIGLDAYPYSASSTVLDPDWVNDRIRVMITTSKPHPEATGRDLADLAEEWDLSLKEAAVKLSPAGAIYFQIDEDDVQRILAYPPTMIGSDGLPHDEHPHPRLWGTFPRVLGHYCRDLGIFDLETAVHKMTGLPAQTFGLADRGVVREGAYADLVVFNAEKVQDMATFEKPLQQSKGIDYVFVNGTLSLMLGNLCPDRAGQVVRNI